MYGDIFFAPARLSVDTRNESILDDLAVSLPIVAVLASATFKVARASVRQHGQEKRRIKERNGRVESSAHSPSQGLNPIGRVIRLASPCPESTGEQLVSVLGLDIRRVLDDGARKLRKGLAGHIDTLLLHLEGRLLSHGAVKDVVCAKQGHVEGDVGHERKMVS